VTDVSDRIEKVKARYEGCFGCGRANAIGLQLDGFQSDGTVVTASFVPREEYRGFDGILHGGIVAAALDEVLGWTAILLHGSMAVTAKLELRYRPKAAAGVSFSKVCVSPTATSSPRPQGSFWSQPASMAPEPAVALLYQSAGEGDSALERVCTAAVAAWVRS
jgi:hypothetical protein